MLLLVAACCVPGLIAAARAEAYNNGDFVTVYGLDSGRIYREVGGAPVWLTSCVQGCTPMYTQNAAWLQSQPAYPANGSYIRSDDTETIFRIIGGALYPMTSCFDGCPGAVDVPQATLDRGDHLEPYSVDGSLVRDHDNGNIYEAVGGALWYLNDCSVASGCAGAVDVNDYSIGAYSSAHPVAVDGTLVRIDTGPSTGNIYRVVGGTLFYISDCAVLSGDCGGVRNLDQVSIAQYETAHPTIADGHLVRADDGPGAGTIYVSRGGTLYPISDCAPYNGCAGVIELNQVSIDQYLAVHPNGLATSTPSTPAPAPAATPPTGSGPTATWLQEDCGPTQKGHWAALEQYPCTHCTTLDVTSGKAPLRVDRGYLTWSTGTPQSKQGPLQLCWSQHDPTLSSDGLADDFGKSLWTLRGTVNAYWHGPPNKVTNVSVEAHVAVQGGGLHFVASPGLAVGTDGVGAGVTITLASNHNITADQPVNTEGGASEAHATINAQFAASNSAAIQVTIYAAVQVHARNTAVPAQSTGHACIVNGPWPDGHPPAGVAGLVGPHGSASWGHGAGKNRPCPAFKVPANPLASAPL